MIPFSIEFKQRLLERHPGVSAEALTELDGLRSKLGSIDAAQYPELASDTRVRINDILQTLPHFEEVLAATLLKHRSSESHGAPRHEMDWELSK